MPQSNTKRPQLTLRPSIPALAELGPAGADSLAVGPLSLSSRLSLSLERYAALRRQHTTPRTAEAWAEVCRRSPADRYQLPLADHEVVDQLHARIGPDATPTLADLDAAGARVLVRPGEPAR